MSEIDYANLIDATTGKSTAVTLPTTQATETTEVLEMVMGLDNDTVMGRLSHGFDPSDFDLIPRNRVYDTPNQSEGPAGDELDLLAGDAVPQVFRSPAPEQFPLLKQALRAHAAESQPKVARIDTESTYGDFVCQRAVEEIDRRLAALEGALQGHMDDDHAHHVDRVMRALEEHVSDPYAHKSRLVRQIDDAEVLGAAEAISDLRRATTADQAVEAMPAVPVDMPAFCEGKVKCWKDGDHVICSIRFQGPDRAPRVATMAAKPSYDADAIEGWAMGAGAGAEILGMVSDLADSACGKRLVRDTARAAMEAQKRQDVMGMAKTGEPVVLVSRGDKSNAPLAAIMSVQQRANVGDRQAQREMGMLRVAAQTPSGRLVAAPLLDEAARRLGTVKQMGAARDSFIGRYTLMGGCL